METRWTSSEAPPPKKARARIPVPAAIGITTARPTMARVSRRSPAASRKSRSATRSALRRSSFILFPVPHDGEVDLLQGGPLDDLAMSLQAGGARQRMEVAGGEQPASGHDPDADRPR